MEFLETGGRGARGAKLLELRVRQTAHEGHCAHASHDDRTINEPPEATETRDQVEFRAGSADAGTEGPTGGGRQ